jgi:MFS family permease
LLKGNASTYGLLLGCAGVGAVAGALLVSTVRERLKAEHAYALCAIVGGLMIIAIGLSRSVLLTGAIMAVAGAVSMLAIALLNVGVQLSVPRWVAARALSLFQASLTGGVAIGAVIWGHVATDWGVDSAFFASGSVLVLTPLIGLILPIPRVSYADFEVIDLGHEPEVALALTARSGPIVIEIDYRVAAANARHFYNAMLQLQRAKLRNGGFNWSLARNIGDPELWTERYHCPTWADYLRQRSRLTQADRELQAAADAFNTGSPGNRVRRRLERPFGSVRWRADSPDPLGGSISVYTP